MTAGLALFLLLAPGLAGLGRGGILPLVGAALAMALYCSLFCGLCCLLTEGAAGCGTASFALALAFLALAGGIVPPVLMPAGLQRLIGLSPVTWLMELAAWAMGYEVPPATWLFLALSATGMAALSLVLYQRRTDRQELEGLFTLLTGPGSAAYPLVRETVSACVAECISPAMAEGYLLDSGILTEAEAVQARPRLRESLLERDRVLVALETWGGAPMDPLALADRGVDDLLAGAAAVLLLVWALFAAMDLGR